MSKIYSFDILDTCLCRTCGEPYAVFDILARTVIGNEITISQLADFRYIRMQGEQIARAKSKSEDITINDIYNECDFSGLTKLSHEDIISKEIFIEKNVLRPIKRSLDFIKKLHENDIAVYYISDMYLPSHFFKELLENYGFWKEGDKIYVSCEIGRSKDTGNLFHYVANDIGKSFRNWHHYGDNRHSDYNVPRRLGIRGHQLRNDYSFYQNYLRKKDYDVAESYMGRVAGISRALYLGGVPNIRRKFAADIIAPLYVSFTYNILKNAESRGINRLFFLARDGYVIYQIAKEMMKYFPSIDVKYLYVSRKALYLPNLENIDRDSIRSILPKKSMYDDEIFDFLQIDVDGLTYEEFEQSGLPPSLERKLNERWNEQKKNVIGYFRQEGLADNEANTAIVDIRGSRKCQRSINKILSENGFKTIHAYYLEVTNDRVTPNSYDEYDAYYFGDFHRSENFANMNVMTMLLERYFCISYAKRTAGYSHKENGYSPEFDEGEYLPEYYKEISEINSVVCIEYSRHFFCNYLQVFSKDIFNYSLSLISSFASSPNKEYVKALCGVEFSESKYHSKRIVDRLTPKVAWSNNYKWFRGSLVLTSPILLICYKKAREIVSYIRYIIK